MIFLVTLPVLVALLVTARSPVRSLGPDDTARSIHGPAIYAVATGRPHGLRTVGSGWPLRRGGR